MPKESLPSIRARQDLHEKSDGCRSEIRCMENSSGFVQFHSQPFWNGKSKACGCVPNFGVDFPFEVPSQSSSVLRSGLPLARIQCQVATEVFFGFDNFLVAYAGRLMEPADYMSVMFLMISRCKWPAILLICVRCPFRVNHQTNQRKSLFLVAFLGVSVP